MGWRPDVQEEIQNAEKPETGRHGCWEHQETCLEVLPAEDGALPDVTVPALGKGRLKAQCWWCRYQMQMRDHLLKECQRWKEQQKTLWREVYKETGRGKRRWRAHDLFADQ